jgi:hypothetical protein
MGGLLVLLLLWAAVGGGIGYWIGSGKGRGGVGFVLGLAFGWIGWIIVALLHPTAEVEARRMASLADALRGDETVSGLGRPCPWCAEIIKPAASVCRYCGRTVQPAPAAVIDASAAALQLNVRVAEKHKSINASTSPLTTTDIEDCFDFADPRDLDRSLRRRLRFAIDGVRTLSSGENLVGVVPVEADKIPGLLVLSDERILFFDEVTGLLDIVFNRAETAASKSGDSVTIRDNDGGTTFVRYATPRPAVSSSPTHRAGVPAVRSCGGCGAEFTPAYFGDDCPDCGASLSASEG